MKYTGKLKLKKPDYTDSADIEDINGNMDTLDKEICDLKTKVSDLETKINNMQNSIWLKKK